MQSKEHSTTLENSEKIQPRQPEQVVQLQGRSWRNRRADQARIGHERGTHHPEYPLERVCRHLYQPFQLKFARQAEQLLTKQDDLEVVCSHAGLTIRAETDEILRNPVETLRSFYGSQLHVGPATIRYHNATTLEEPWMGLRVRCAPVYFEAIKADLRMRQATIVGSELRPRIGLIYASAPLSKLVGYGVDLAKLTRGTAQQLMWLSHYAPVNILPPDGDAA